MKKIKKAKKAKVDNSSYKATVKILGKFYKAEGGSVAEAISNLKPGNVRGLGVLTIEHGDKKVERILPPFTTNRLFNFSGTTRAIMLKNVTMRFGL